MKLGIRKLSFSDYSVKTVLFSMVSLIISFVIQLFFVFKWNYFRYSYDEFQIMAMGAHYSRYSWDNLATSAPYGGVFFILLYKMLFSLGISGTATYRVLRWGMAVLCAIPAYISSRVASKYYNIDFITSIVLGVIATLASTVRASSVRSDVILALFVWLLVYALICYSRSESIKYKTLYSVIAGVELALMPFANVKSLVLVIAFAVAVALIRVFKKKWMISIVGFVPAFLLCSGVCNFIFDRIILSYSAGKDWETSWTLETKKYLYSILSGVQRFHMSYSIRGFLDLFVSNIWIVAIFSCGIVIYAFVYAISKLKSGKERNDFESGTLLFLGIGTIFSMLTISFISIKAGIYIHSREGTPNGQLFNLAAYGYLICPMLVLELMILLKRGKDSVRCLIPTMVVVFVSGLYTVSSVLVPTLNNGNASMKWWFGYETPFLVMLNQWADKDTGVWFFILPTVIVLFLMWCYHKSGDYKTVVSFVCLVAFVQYGYIEFYWANRASYRNRYDAFISYVTVGSLSESGISDVYLDADRDIAYAMQMALPGITIHIGAPESYEKNVVILTAGKPSDVCRNYKLDHSYKAIALDGNEIIVTNNPEISGILSESLFVYDADTLVFDYVGFLYQHILGREADGDGLRINGLWLMNEGVEPSDLIMVLLNCDELQCRGYTNEQMAETMCNAFWGYPGNKELVHTMAQRLDSGESLEDVAGDLINSDRYFEVLKSFGLRDDKADRLYSYVNRIYNHILERPADEIGATGFCDMIREGEITPDDFVNLLIDSEEHQGLGRSTEYTVIRLFMLYTNTFPELETVHWYAERIDSGEMSYRDLQETLSDTVAYHNIIMDYNIEEYI